MSIVWGEWSSRDGFWSCKGSFGLLYWGVPNFDLKIRMAGIVRIGMMIWIVVGGVLEKRFRMRTEMEIRDRKQRRVKVLWWRMDWRLKRLSR
jgi:hypothetical protein